LGEKERWQVEVAALLSQLPSIALPNETVEKLYYGAPLSAAEQAMVERAPDVTQQLLGHIPRLEGVRGILATYAGPYRKRSGADVTPEEQVVARGAQLLKIALDYDTLEAQGMTAVDALKTINGRAEIYDPEVLTALFGVCTGRDEREAIREVSLAALKPGMTFAQDVKLNSGALFVARGYEVTESFLERIKNFRPGSVKEPVKVVLRSEP
jgi:hypothetical protein